MVKTRILVLGSSSFGGGSAFGSQPSSSQQSAPAGTASPIEGRKKVTVARKNTGKGRLPGK